MLSQKRLAVSEEGGDGPSRPWAPTHPLLRQLADVQKEYTLAMAHLLLAKPFPDLQDTSRLLVPQDAVSLLMETGLVETAVTVAHTFGLGLDSVFEQLTRKCLAAEQDIRCGLKGVHAKEGGGGLYNARREAGRLTGYTRSGYGGAGRGRQDRHGCERRPVW